jgi:hypothetical protein
MNDSMKEDEVVPLSSIKPQSKPILTENEVLSFENCLKSDNITIDQESKITLNEIIENVYVIDNVLSLEECNDLIREINSSDSLSFWCYGKENDEDVKAFRNAKTIEIHSESVSRELFSRIKHLILPHPVLSKIIISSDPDDESYERDIIGNWFPIDCNPDSLFVRYESGGSFAPHTDGRATVNFNTKSFYSIILFLNSVEKNKGAGTRFYSSSATKQLKKMENRWTANSSLMLEEVEAVAGRLLLFHQSLVHEGVPPAEGYSKYIIRSDLIYERSPKICDTSKDKEAYQLFRKAEELAENGEVNESLILFKKALKLSPTLAEIMGQG